MGSEHRHHVTIREERFAGDGVSPFNVSYDIDGITGLYPVDAFSNVVTSAHVMKFGFEGVARRNRWERLRSKTRYMPALSAESSETVNRLLVHLPHIKLGTIETGLGLLNIYYVFGKTTGQDSDERVTTNDNHVMYLYHRIWMWARNAVGSESEDIRQVRIDDVNKSVSGILVRRTFETFFNALSSRHIDHVHDQIYFELYGCKNATISSNIQTVLGCISRVIHVSSLNESLRVDVCLTVAWNREGNALPRSDGSQGGGHDDAEAEQPRRNCSVFLSSEIFESLNLRTNYELFFCTRLRNCHHSMVKWTGSNVVVRDTVNLRSDSGDRIQVDKVNFYNTVEDLIKEVRIAGFFPRLSAAQLKGGLGLRIAGAVDAVEKETTSMHRLVNGIMDSRFGSHPYRLEVTVPFPNAESALESLRSNVEQSTILVLDSEEMMDTVVATARGIVQGMTCTTIDSVFTCMVKEIALMHLFYQGSKNIHILPQSCRDGLNGLMSENLQVVSIGDVDSTVSQDEKELCLRVLIGLDRSITHDYTRAVLNRLVDVGFAHRSRAFRSVVIQYFCDMVRYRRGGPSAHQTGDGAKSVTVEGLLRR